MKRANMKKALAMLLALMTVLASLAMISVSVAATEDTLEGDGTQATPYLINTPADLLALSKEIGNSERKVYMKLTADIDMTGVDSFKSIKLASGNKLFFDGQNHTISNMTVTSGISGNYVGGLFQQIRAGSTVENVHMENVTVNALEGKNVVGGIAGYVTAPFTMKNCTVSGSVTSNYTGTGNSTAGGLVGAIGGGSGEVIFEHCLNQATIVHKGTVHATAGGMTAGIEDATNYIFRYCMNEGAISTVSEQNSSAAKPSAVGGILGFSKNIAGLGDEAAQVFESCVNTGDLLIADTALANAMGGILGSGRAPNSASAAGPALSMTNCYDNSKRSFGAIAFGTNGAFAGVSCAKTSFRSFTDCYAVNKADSESPYTILQTEDMADETLLDIVSSAIIAATDTPITLSSGKVTTMAAEIAMINSARLCGGHEYDNDCDATCNKGCGYERPISELHSFFDDCDATCDFECGYVRTAPHKYENACDTSCDVCGATRTAADHVYANGCDVDCNVCGATRTPGEHVYDDDKDKFCNECGEQRELPKPAETTTTAPADTTPVEEEKGCKNAINSTYAVLALVAVLGFAFVAKKREEN